MLRKVHSFDFEENLFWECLLDRTVLNQMLDVLQKLLHLSKETEKLQEAELLADYTEKKEQMFDLMNQYYELSTPTDFSFDKLKIIESIKDISDEITKLLQMREVENAS